MANSSGSDSEESGAKESGEWADYEHNGIHYRVPVAADVSPRAAHHILYGESVRGGASAAVRNARSGGHLAGQHLDDKSMFPPHWSPQRIIDTAQRIRDDSEVPTKGKPRGVRFKAATVDGLDVVVKLGPSGAVVTFYPHVGPGVTWSWNGEVFPQETWEQYKANKRRRTFGRE